MNEESSKDDSEFRGVEMSRKIPRKLFVLLGVGVALLSVGLAVLFMHYY